MDFEASLAHGPHAQLARLVGRYDGRARLWMRPDELDDDEPVTGEITVVGGGRFVRHDYVTRIGGEEQSGSALVGCDLSPMRWVSAWGDSWHTGTDLMVFEGPCDESSSRVDLLTSYGEGEAHERWGWRTTYEPAEAGVLVRHYNIPPEGAGLGGEYLAVELDYSRAT